MAVTSFYKEHGNRWLTSIYNGAEGSEHTLSIGHPLRGGEFTTYRLAAPVATDDRKQALFDLDEALVEFDSDWLPLADVRRMVNDWSGMRARGYKWGAFGMWKKAA